MAQALVELTGLAQLIRSLQSRGCLVIGPRARDGAIVYDPIDKLEDLPLGWTDEQESGHYRLKPGEDGALFSYNLGPQSWKEYLHPAELCFFAAERNGSDFTVLDNPAPPPRYAFLGVRACELAAIRIQDRVLAGDQFVDRGYRARRDNVFIVAVECTLAAPTCFCTSMGAGPRVEGGYDLVLTELPGGAFLVSAGSRAGGELLGEIDHRAATAEELREAEAARSRAAAQITRRIDTTDVARALYDSFASPIWDEIAARCLACANCTLVCPTCFCTTVEDTSDIACRRAERWRKWDSCFTESFSYIHGGSVRLSVKSRYRQWLIHKLAAWVDQFDSLGCVGCGRCITWCPGKIDITKEVARLVSAEGYGWNHRF